MNKRRWLLYFLPKSNFPYSIYIEGEQGKFLSLKSKERWPGAGKNIFCKWEGWVEEKDIPSTEPIEEVDILNLKITEKRISVILDRTRRKRFYFIILKKEYKNSPGNFYHQVFWITQTRIVRERRGVYIPQGGKKKITFTVWIDKREKYPYQFPSQMTERKILPAGDYALVKEREIIALVERKRGEEFIRSLSAYDSLKLQLQELINYPYKALVLENLYEDILHPKKIFSSYSPSFLADILSDMEVSFPELKIKFFKNRKSAQEWVFRWFKRIAIEK